MKIKVLNPDSGLTPEQLRIRENRMMSIARPDTIVEMRCQTDTMVCVDSALDEAVTALELIKMTILAEKEGYDVVGIYCAEDPALTACREAVSIPVIGGGQTSIQIAMGLGSRFSWITSEKTPVLADRFIRTTGIEYARVVSIRCMELDIVAARNADQEKIVKDVTKAGRKCMEEDGAQVLILGCLVFAGMGKKVSEALGVPVVDPALSIISMAELLYYQGLTHSKLAYPVPPAGSRSWKGGSLQL